MTSLADAAIPTVDEAEVVVVGGGPAGCTAAAHLAELGHDVLILDKDDFPRDKPCGDGLMHPAVAAAERLGLDELLEASVAIEASRVVIGHRRQTETSLTGMRGQPQPRCITRRDFDSALLGAARERGARFMRARVDRLEGEEDGRRLIAVADGASCAVSAGVVIAADGATSRLRNVTSEAAPKRASACAVRQYFRTEKPLDPVLEGYLPLELDGRVLAGYGWVFPIDEHTANIGVGLFGGIVKLPPLTRVQNAFVEELRSKAAYRFGDLEATDKPMGSPMGIRSPIQVSGIPGLTLVGDAAGTTHALTGEGIPFAMKGGEVVAEAVHGRITGKGRRHRPPEHDDAALWRGFPQIGIDATGLSRIGTLELNKGASELMGPVSEPYLAIVKRMQRESAYETAAEGTPTWDALEAHRPELADQLERANDLLLERLAYRMPFVAEVTHRFIRSQLGPMYAAVALAVADSGDEDALEAAAAAESVGVLPKLLTMLVDQADSKSLRANNAIAVLTGDFAATRALAAAAKLGRPAVTALGLACQQGCEGGMEDAAARFAADRSVESWIRAARETAGAAAVLATQLGQIVGACDAPAETLREYGIELGISIRLAEEIVSLTVGDEMHPGREGEDLRRGIYPLPLLYSVEAEPAISQLLARHMAEGKSPQRLIAAIRESGGIARAVVECESRVRAATALAEEVPGAPGAALAAIASIPTDFVTHWADGGPVRDRPAAVDLPA